MRRALALIACCLLSTNADASSAIVQITQDIGKNMAQVPPGSLVVASSITSDVPLSKGDEIALRIANILAGKLPGQARANPQPLTLSAAHGAAKGKPAVVFLRIEIARGDLRVTADAFPVVSNTWDRVRLPPPPPLAHVFASAPIDAEIRASMPPIPLEQAQLHKSKHEEGEVLAAACGDIDGDGSLEIALVSKEKVSIGRLRQGKLAIVKSAPWQTMGPRAPVSLREPLAGAFVSRGEGLLVGTTDQNPILLDINLKPRESLHGIPLAGTREACAMVDASASAFGGAIVPCRGPVRSLPILVDPAVKRFDAGAFSEIADARGQTTPFTAVREPGGKLQLKEIKRTIDGTGAQIAVADLDLDGNPEIVTSTNSDPDELRIMALDGRVRARFPAPGGIRAVCICPPEERGIPSVIAISGDEVWLVR